MRSIVLMVPMALEGVTIDTDSSPAHKGYLERAMDLLCEEGKPVYAAASGKVTWLKNDSDVGGDTLDFYELGNGVELHHCAGICTTYEHMRYDSIVVEEGQYVERGQFLGLSGATGYLAGLGPHLHFACYLWRGSEESSESIEPDFRLLCAA